MNSTGEQATLSIEFIAICVLAFNSERGSDSLFLSLDVLRIGNGRRLDDVNDVDANPRRDLVHVGNKLPVISRD